MRPTKKNELKECPFCGGKPYMCIGKKLDKSTDYSIHCSHCGSRTMTFNNREWGEAKAEAIRRWNKRFGQIEINYEKNVKTGMGNKVYSR